MSKSVSKNRRIPCCFRSFGLRVWLCRTAALVILPAALLSQAPGSHDAVKLSSSRPDPKALSPLTEDEQRLAKQLVLEDSTIRHMLGSGHPRFCSIELVTPKLSDDDRVPPRRARVVLYTLATNQGASAIVDLSAKKVYQQEALDSDQIPVAVADIEEARKLIQEDPKLKAILSGDPSAYHTDLMLVRGSEESDPCKKDRCLSAFFRERMGTILQVSPSS